ncbi:hypothetical protein [Rhizobium sp. Root1204]|uniref:hypothetical protein n=1 Tax=Rhizobium sp. Root1204 TaxID=1736428 RepID=UPI0007151CA1|nr:hypothetical protein [Rhizobium sp. Root1204]KQV31104.1 hypothetical protein ASC96_07895 [Rhizobium sp. Root1204]
MKIIGETKDGYIVQMTKDEAAQASGYYSSYSDDWRKLGAGVGTEIKFTAAISYHSQIRKHQDEARKSAGMLRALADMMDGVMPDVVIPPADQTDEVAI